MLKLTMGIVWLVFPLVTLAQESGWSTFGRVLGGGTDREGAYQEGLREGAEVARLREEARELRIQAELERVTEQRREWLAKQWLSVGFSDDSARAIADVYVPSEMDKAIIATTRSKGSASAIAAIRKALGDYNYELANRLAIAWSVVLKEEEMQSPQNNIP